MKLRSCSPVPSRLFGGPRAGARVETPPGRGELPAARSRPARARGLKHAGASTTAASSAVAPLAGARVETLVRYRPIKSRSVAPLAGARVETTGDAPPTSKFTQSRPSRARGLKLSASRFRQARLRWSRPSRARGLKRFYDALPEINRFVAPLAGARVETASPWRTNRKPWSRPSRARGLKQPLRS